MGIYDEYMPFVSILSVSHRKISKQSGMDRSTIAFSFDKNVIEWVVRVGGMSPLSGNFADSSTSDYIVAGKTQTAVIDWSECRQEGENRVNIYGRGEFGVWTSYEFAEGIPENSVKVIVTTSGKAVQLPKYLDLEITIVALLTNTGYIYIGDSSGVYEGYAFAAGESLVGFVEDTSLIYIDASVSGEGVALVLGD